MMKNVLLLVLFPALMRATLSQTHVFYYVPENMSWSEAQTHCRQHYTDLATVDDLTDHRELLNTLRAGLGAEWIWTGLYRTDAAAPWIWSDQSRSAFRPWAIGQPNNNGGSQFCARTSLTGLFNDGECYLKYAAVCYNKRRTQTVRLMVKSSQNVNDSEVKKHILSMLEQMLMEKGLTEDVKLTYRNQSDGNVFQKDQNTNVTEHTIM